MAVLSDNSKVKNSNNLSLHTGEGVVIDIGTGDGRFVYRSAEKNPNKFYIGIDANAKALEKISIKATRKPNKGGLPNVLFLQSAVENIPEELDGVADEIHLHFPWGSLLRAVVLGDPLILSNLRRICASECLVEIVIGLDEERDKSEIERLQLPNLTAGYLENLFPKYESAGFKVLEKGILETTQWEQIETSWVKKLQGNAKRKVIYFVLEAV